MLPVCDEDNLRTLLERLRAGVANTSVAYNGQMISFTVSIGATVAIPPQETGAEVLLRAADLALYRAKSSGRNRLDLGSV